MKLHSVSWALHVLDYSTDIHDELSPVMKHYDNNHSSILYCRVSFIQQLVLV